MLEGFEEKTQKRTLSLRLNEETYDALDRYKATLEKQIGFPLKYNQVIHHLINNVKEAK